MLACYQITSYNVYDNEKYVHDFGLFTKSLNLLEVFNVVLTKKQVDVRLDVSNRRSGCQKREIYQPVKFDQRELFSTCIHIKSFYLRITAQDQILNPFPVLKGQFDAHPSRHPLIFQFL